MTSTRKRVAVLGAGMIGEVHRRAALLAGAEVVGVMASTPERSRAVAEAWGVEQAFSSIDEVAASDVDAVHICTPNSSHVPYAVQLMEAGKHVLCEKPLGVSLADAVQLARDYVIAAIRHGADVRTGSGHGPLNHGFAPVPMQKLAADMAILPAA